jgi:hypothetical protein
MRHSLSGRDEKSLMKLIVDSVSQRVLGVHMVGTDAPEIIQGMSIAIRMGATKADFDATVALHPSAAEEFVTMRDKIIKRRGNYLSSPGSKYSVSKRRTHIDCALQSCSVEEARLAAASDAAAGHRSGYCAESAAWSKHPSSRHTDRAH